MSQTYIGWLRTHATNRAILGTFGLLVFVEGLFVVLLLPRFRTITDGRKIPDSMVAYSYDEIYATIDGYGTAGIEFYRYLGALDLLFPLVYGLFLALVLARLLPADAGRSQILLYVPLVTVVLDYLENLGIFVMLWRHPREYALVATLTNGLTLLKFSGLALSVLFVLVLAGRLLYHRV